MKQIYILFLLVAATTAVNPIIDQRFLNVEKNQQKSIASPGYPNSAPLKSNIVWDINSDHGTQLVLECDDIRITQTENCKSGYFMVFDGQNGKKYCGSKYHLKIKSFENQMRIEFDLNYAVGVFNCNIRVIENELGQTMNAELPETHSAIELQPEGSPFTGIMMKPIPKYFNKTWHFITNAPNRLSLFCRYYALDNCENEKAFLTADDTISVKKACGVKLEDPVMVSSTNKLNIKVETDDRSSYTTTLECIVQAVTGDDPHEYKNVLSHEIDSSEFGVTKGFRNTTCECGLSKPNRGRIINGEVVINEEQYPWMASLNHRGRHRCGAAIVTEYHAITASHCTNGLEVKDFKLYMGTINKTHAANGQIVPISRLIGYDTERSSRYDIAVVVTSEKIHFTRNVYPICLLAEHTQLNRQYITITGWGNLGPSAGKINPIELRRTRLRITDFDLCIFLSKEVNTTIPSKICVWARNTTTCRGDSGSPLAWVDPETNRYTLVSVLSSGSCSEYSSLPSMGAYIPFFYEWIQNQIKDTMPEIKTCQKI